MLLSQLGQLGGWGVCLKTQICLGLLEDIVRLGGDYEESARLNNLVIGDHAAHLIVRDTFRSKIIEAALVGSPAAHHFSYPVF